MRLFYFCFFLLLSLTAPFLIVAEQVEPPAINYSINPRIFGANIDIDFGFPSIYSGQWTQLHTRIGGAWEQEEYHRNSDGSLFFADSESDIAQAQHHRIEANIRLGLLQGFGWNIHESRPDAILYSYFSSSYDHHFQNTEIDQLVFDSGYPDSRASLTNSVSIGLYQNKIEHLNGISQGQYREIAIEYGPRWLANSLSGNADYLRLHGRYSIHQKLFSPGLYLVNTLFADYLWSSESHNATIPLNQRARFGGYSGTRGLGGTVRGFGGGRFDSDIKLANSMDIRYSLPLIPALQTRIGLIGYWDIGYYKGLRDMPIPEDPEITADNKENSGWLVSNGAGISLTLMEQATIVLYIDYAWFGAVVHESRRIRPFSIDFGFHH